VAAKALDAKTKELNALAIGIAVYCDDCIAFHVKASRVLSPASKPGPFHTTYDSTVETLPLT
jgi:AhpD family alkylhydroperoxidase